MISQCGRIRGIGAKNHYLIKMSPILRWAGSKRQLVSQLKTFWPSDASCYVEPFCGSACLFFALEPKRAVLGDLNEELVTSYEVLKCDAGSVFEKVSAMPETKDFYYELRGKDFKSMDSVDVAARFIYLNRNCFNGIYRTNLCGNFNVPRGTRGGRKFDYSILMDASRLLKRTKLVFGDFEETLSNAKFGDFVYMDPPYAVKDKRMFSEYLNNSFSVKDLDRLSRALFDLNEKGVRFVVSYADSEEARKLFEPWLTQEVRVKRNVAGFSKNRRMATELIATNIF